MKTNIAVLYVLAAYFVVLTAVYTVWAHIEWGHTEWVGSIAIALSGVLSVFIAFYLQIQNKNQGGVLPEDRLDAEIDDGDPELGYFSPWSWWPVSLAGGAVRASIGSSGPRGMDLRVLPRIFWSLIHSRSGWRLLPTRSG